MICSKGVGTNIIGIIVPPFLIVGIGIKGITIGFRVLVIPFAIKIIHVPINISPPSLMFNKKYHHHQTFATLNVKVIKLQSCFSGVKKQHINHC
jgi:hypothetical protein